MGLPFQLRCFRPRGIKNSRTSRCITHRVSDEQAMRVGFRLDLWPILRVIHTRWLLSRSPVATTKDSIRRI